MNQEKSGVRTGGDATAAAARNETDAQRADRKWNDMLQELRVMQTSAQLTAGFLLTLPFQQSFDGLSDRQRNAYLGLVLLAAVVTALVLSPVAIHRRLSGELVKDRLVKAAHVIMQAALGLLALLVVGIVTFIFDVVTEGTAALVAGGVLALVLVAFLLVLPRALVDR
jgi:hypothetical protein